MQRKTQDPKKLQVVFFGFGFVRVLTVRGADFCNFTL